MENILFELSDIYFDNVNLQFNLKNFELFLSELEANRMIGIVYKNLMKLKQIPIEPRNMERLKLIYEGNIEKAEIFKSNVLYLAGLLDKSDFQYALLKGAYLSTKMYEEGLRTSTDIDLLLQDRDIGKCQKILLDNGFIQGSLNKEENTIVPALRREILISRMNYGETVPFLKEIDGKILEIDLNFSLDFKPSVEKRIIETLLDRTVDVEIEKCKFKTLCLEDFLIHLCCHLYKEATTFNWVEFKRDLDLYKFSDINLFLHTHHDSEFMNKLLLTIKEYDVKKECYYTFYNTAKIFPKMMEIQAFCDLLKNIKPDNVDFMKEIVKPDEQKIYAYDMEFEDWFFCKDKQSRLRYVRDMN